MSATKRQYHDQINPDSPRDVVVKTVDRMKTETIHAQALQLEYLRQRLIESEDLIKKLTADKRTLELKLLASQRILQQQTSTQGENHGS